MSLRVHALVNHTDDDDPVPCMSVENDVLASLMGAQALFDVIPWRAQAGGVPDRLEPVLDLAQVFTLLDGAPLTPRIISDPPQVILRGVG